MAQTLGPEDQAASTRVKGYTVLAGVLGLLPVLVVFRVITQEQAASIQDFFQSGIGLAGAFGFAFVASKTKAQINNGTFDAAPAPSPAQNAVEGMSAVSREFNELTTTVAAGLELVHKTAQQIPGLGPLIAAGGALGGTLTDQVLELTRQRDSALQTAERRQQPPS